MAQHGMKHRMFFVEPLESRQLLSGVAIEPLPTSASSSDTAGAVLAAAASASTGPAEPSVTYIQSPNYGSRPAGQDIDAIVIHTTEGSYQSAVNTFLSTASQVSAHYIVNTDGTITQMVQLDKRAWHATYYNDRSVGIEVVGYAGQASTWNANNVAALQKLTAWLAWKYDVPVVHPSGDAYDYPNDQLNISGIVAHGQVQPWNRTDPGPYFPWTTFIPNVQKIIDDSAEPKQSPYKGVPFAVGTGITATIQAEDYDLGGEGVAYHDTNATNTGGAYRPGEGVDLKLIANTSNSYRLGDAYPGEWTEYSINVQQSGNYDFLFSVSQSDPNAKMHAEIDGVNVTGSMTVPDTNNFSVFTNLSKTLSLSSGNHVLRLGFDTVAKNGTVAGVDYVRISPTASTGSSSVIGTSTTSYVRGGTYAGKNFGSDSKLYVKQSASADNIRESYFKFDLSSVSSLSNAVLRLSGKLSDTQSSSVKLNVYSITDTSWSESGLTYANRPTAGATLRGSATVTGTSTKTYDINLTSFLASEKAAGHNTVTLVLRGDIASGSSIVFNSDETSTGPKLVVNS